jgi:hypothetical protein
MKEKTINALHAMLNLASDDLGFLIIWGTALAVILKLACV